MFAPERRCRRGGRFDSPLGTTGSTLNEIGQRHGHACGYGLDREDDRSYTKEKLIHDTSFTMVYNRQSDQHTTPHIILSSTETNL
eukprot:551774-Amorphochlora_amoeboformis.AAC.2